MKRLHYIMLGLFSIALVACQSDSREKSVEQVQASIANKPNEKSTIRQQVDPTPADTVNVGAFSFEEKSFDFGTIDEGDIVEHVFKFKNTGKVPLVIKKARGSCGCTVPEWPTDPIPVGGESAIKVKFNSKGKPNQQRKTVTLTANTYPATTMLTIRGNVIPDPSSKQRASSPTNTKKPQIKASGNTTEKQK